MLPDWLRARLTVVLDTTIQDVVPLTGGAINQAARVETGQGAVFVKWRTDHGASDETLSPDLYIAEADGLERLRSAPEGPPVPSVLQVASDFLVLEYVATTTPVDTNAFTQRFAERLAALHRSARADTFGLERDNYLGLYPQVNVTREVSWAAFYRHSRLEPQLTRAHASGLVPPDRSHLLREVVDHLEYLLNELPDEPPSLLHGDLWSGNFLVAHGDRPVLVDPAAYYGPREMELAYIELFGGFPPGFVRAYHAAFPLDDGYARRRPLHQLYPLLVHLNYFGEEYGPWVERTCRAALARSG